MLRIKKDDLVKVIAGGNKGKTGKVTKVEGNKVWVEGVNVRERHIRASQFNPRGGKKEIQIPVDISNLALVIDGKDATSKVSFKVSDDGKKSRVAKTTGKEIK